MWLDAEGNRLAAPNFPGFDTNATMREILKTGHDYSWFVLTQTIIEKEFMLSGSSRTPMSPARTSRSWRAAASPGAPGPVDAFTRHGVDFVVADDLPTLVAGMNKISRGPALDLAHIERVISTRDAQIDNKFTKDAQIMAMTNARQFVGDKVVRVAKPHKILDPAHGPLIAVRLNILTRKTLGGLETNLDSAVMRPDGTQFDGLYAAGEVAGFGGGGVHGYNALEGTFLGGCIFSGRAAGRAVASI